MTDLKRLSVCLAAFVALLIVAGCGGPSSDANSGKPTVSKSSSSGEKVVRLPIRTDGPKSLDPVQGSTTYDNMACVQIYEALVQYKYLKRPLQLEPLLLAEMPKSEVTADGRMVYKFKLKQGVHFHDDPCFPGGKGRTVTSSDVFYSWKRMANKNNKPKSWWLFENTILGFDEYRDAQNKASEFDYDAAVPGMRIINEHEFEVVLKEPVHRFMWIIEMFQTAVVPREAVEHYKEGFARHPVGTGPFMLKNEADWVPGKSMTLYRNPNYHASTYPSEHMPEDAALGFDKPAGQPIPFVDKIEYTMYVEDQPMWLEFRAGEIGYTQVPDEYWDQAYVKRTKKLRKELGEEGIVSHRIPLFDFIFRTFNMEDELVGGYTDKKRKLRQAFALALDWNEQNETFYHGENVLYDGMIPPGLDGHPEGGNGPVSFRGPNLAKARQLLAEAGYPEGKGLPKIEYWSNKGGNIPEQVEMTKRQLAEIGVRINPHLVDFSTLIEAVDNKKAQMFSFAWGSDYPDGENNLALYYGPNESPGSNHSNYKNAEYDKLYEKIRVMGPSPERTKIYEQMRDIVLRDTPFCGSMARTRNYLVNPWLKNFKPTETFYNWVKYLDVK